MKLLINLNNDTTILISHFILLSTKQILLSTISHFSMNTPDMILIFAEIEVELNIIT